MGTYKNKTFSKKILPRPQCPSCSWALLYIIEMDAFKGNIKKLRSNSKISKKIATQNLQAPYNKGGTGRKNCDEPGAQGLSSMKGILPSQQKKCNADKFQEIAVIVFLRTVL